VPDVRRVKRRFRWASATLENEDLSERRLADQPSAEADCHRMGSAARLELGQQVPHVTLHRLLGEEEPLADLAVH
jgi:hypothetical protein